MLRYAFNKNKRTNLILENKVVLITGANGGLGFELVKMFLDQNVKKIYCAIRSNKDASSLKALSSKVEIIILDISKQENIKNIACKIKNIDLLVNNAGANSKNRVFENSSLDFDVNVIGTLNLTRALSKKINKNGLIINITSITALINNPLIALYSASKSALHSLTQAIRAEMSLQEIHVLEVLPGPLDTNMTKGREMEKANPKDVANEIYLAIKNNEEEVYPDTFSKMIKNNLDKDAKALEKQFQEVLKNI